MWIRYLIGRRVCSQGSELPSANVVDTGHTGHSQAVQKVSNGLYHQTMGEFWSIHQRTEVASPTVEPLE